MNKRTLLFSLIITLGLISSLTLQAQVSGLWQKAKDKATQKASEAVDKNMTDATTSPSKKSNKLTINSGSDFIAGDSILFTEYFSEESDGASAHTFKTNGSANVVSVKEIGGKWLSLQDNSTYKLTKQLFYPKHFTVEFDVLAIADQVKDIYPLVFGFTKDNSVRDFNSADGAFVNLKYYNDHGVNVNSSYNGKYLDADFDFTTFTNQKMHVSIIVNGDRMVAYLDKTKIADTQLFLPTSPKNFYISGPMQYHNGAKLLVSNFRIAMFKKD